MKQDFSPNTIEQNTQSLANYLPNGKLFNAKNIEGSNLRLLLQSIAGEFTRLQNKIYEVSTEYNINNTTNLIAEWESAVGIPDSVFTNTVSLVNRRAQVIMKLAKMNLVTEQDWISFAAYLGYNIQIIHPSSNNIFDYDMDFYFNDNNSISRFVMIIKFVDMPEPESIFDQDFDFLFDDNDMILIPIFEILKPANVRIIYEYKT